MTPVYGDTATRVLLAVICQRRPTVRSVGAAVGLRSVNTVHRYLYRLRSAGLVTWEPGRKGTLRATCQLLPIGEDL